MSNAEVHVFLGDGSEHVAKLENEDGRVTFSPVTLPQTITVVLNDFDLGPDGTFETEDDIPRLEVLTIVDVDVDAIWIWRNWSPSLSSISFVPAPEFDDNGHASGRIIMPGIAERPA